MSKKTFLVVEDSPLLRRLIVTELIARHTGENVDFTTRGMERKLEFGELTIHWSDTLDNSRHLLGTTKFDGAIIDIGFPNSEEESRLEGNRNGLKLVKELREGAYPQNNGLPVAITSVEHVHSKISDFFPQGLPERQITRGFFKGRRASGTEDTNVFNSTASSTKNIVYNTESVAEEPVNWLTDLLRKRDEPDAITSPKRKESKDHSEKQEEKFADRAKSGGWFWKF